MNLQRALSCVVACGFLVGLVGCGDGPRYFGTQSDRAMNMSMWQVTGEETPQVPMPPPEPTPVPPNQQNAGQNAGQNK